MHPASIGELPRPLIEALKEQAETTGQPVVSDDQRDNVLDWLQVLLVDFTSLESHITFLAKLYGSSFRYPRSRRDILPNLPTRKPPDETAFRYKDTLPEERLVAIADQGVKTLSNEELARLLLNPFALSDLFDLINEVLPERWLPLMHTIGQQAMQRARQTSETAQHHAEQTLDGHELLTPPNGVKGGRMTPNYTTALGKLREALTSFKPGQKTYDLIVAPREQVFARYRPIFTCNHIASLSRDEFTSFLYFENNRHWSGLYRRGIGAATDLDKLRQALGVLLDEGSPIRERFPQALDMVNGLGKGIATGILTVAYPEKYGVWNNTSEAGLREVGLWPNFNRGEGIGGRYEEVNNLLLRLSSDLGIDLWTLDALWWLLLEPEPTPAHVPEPGTDTDQGGDSFALERQLEAFLLENWERTPLGREWNIFSTPDDPEAGNQYPTDVGRIDILAKHKTAPRLLVIELKRNQSTDQTVGQALRYLGWVKQHIAESGQSVEALIIAHKVEKDVQYAISTLPHVKLMTYEIKFDLRAMESLRPELSATAGNGV